MNNYEKYKVKNFFINKDDALFKYIDEEEYVWNIPNLTKQILEKMRTELISGEFSIEGKNHDIYIASSAIIKQFSIIEGPAIIMPNAVVGPFAYVRPNVYIGANAKLGSKEIKNSILLDSVEIPHQGYIGDSVFGYKAHLGAGVITSNLKSDRSNIKIIIDGEIIELSFKKMGAIVGDRVEIGCNAVLFPGTIIGSGSTIYPLSQVQGTIDESTIYKTKQLVNIVPKR